jgi:hypothetical protein
MFARRVRVCKNSLRLVLILREDVQTEIKKRPKKNLPQAEFDPATPRQRTLRLWQTNDFWFNRNS